MKVLITEEALETGAGHWPSYIGTIGSGLREAGDEVDILVHKDASEGVVVGGGIPYLSRNCWVDSASQGAVGGIRHNFRFYREVKAWLQKNRSYDRVCALTMRLQHLLAFGLLSRSRVVPDSTKFLLLFVQGFGQYEGDSIPSSFPRNLSTKLARLCFRILRPAVESGRVTLAAETLGMRDELERFTGLQVSLFPHPVPAPPASKERASSLPDVQEDHIPLTITCPGFARHEKGNDLLQEAMEMLTDTLDGHHLKFIMQWPKSFELPDGSFLGPNRSLEEAGRVQFLNKNLDKSAYEDLLSQTDLVILPYRRNSYHHRVSRVAIEAASRGIPLIYMSGTWSEEVAELAGCGVKIRDETAKAVAQAIEEAVGKYTELKKVACSGAQEVARFYSGSEFRQCLFNLDFSEDSTKSQDFTT